MWKRGGLVVGWTAALLLLGVLAMGGAGCLPHVPLFARWAPVQRPAPQVTPAPGPVTASPVPSPDLSPPVPAAPGAAPAAAEALTESTPPVAALPEEASAPEASPPSEPVLSPAPVAPVKSPPAATPAPATARPASLAQTAASPALAAVNDVRALAQLPAVTWDAAWAAQCAAHARYLVRADRAEHREAPDSPHRSAAGEACAHGHYFVSSQPASDARRAVGYWAAGAFHLPQLLDPRLKRVAFGEAHDSGGGFRSAGVLDVRRGLTGRAAYPVRFPAPGATSPYREAAAFEWPDPLAGCPGFTAPAGAPVALLLGPGAQIMAVALKVNGRPVAACLLSAQAFQGAGSGDTAAGRGVLGAQGAAVLLPRSPLPAGAQVQVSFRTSAGRVGWAFRVR